MLQYHDLGFRVGCVRKFPEHQTGQTNPKEVARTELATR